MKIIDAHVHIDFMDREGIIAAKEAGTDFSLSGIMKELNDNGIERAVGIGLSSKFDECLRSAKGSGGLVSPVAGLSVKNIGKQVKRLDRDLEDGKFIGLKLYPGYNHFYPGDKRLEPFYRLAEKHEVPVIFHTGSLLKTPAFRQAMLKYAHPLNVDEVATLHPEMKIVIAHCGNPWFMDTAVVMEKNDNVYTDTSGWFLGDMFKYQDYCATQRVSFLKMLSWIEPERVMFGSDWPLVHVRNYIRFMRSMRLDPDVMEQIMYKTALRLFWK